MRLNDASPFSSGFTLPGPWPTTSEVVSSDSTVVPEYIPTTTFAPSYGDESTVIPEDLRPISVDSTAHMTEDEQHVLMTTTANAQPRPAIPWILMLAGLYVLTC